MCSPRVFENLRRVSSTLLFPIFLNFFFYYLLIWLNLICCFQDGGVLTNNPSAIALHECKLLWPQDNIQSVVSVGTGRYEPTDAPIQESVGLKTKLTKIVQSATDTEG